MIEMLARAAHRADMAINNEKNEAAIEMDWEFHGWRYIERQKAALKALETPTPEMIEAGRKVEPPALEAGPLEPQMKERLLRQFTAMIKAAAQEQGDG